MTLIQHTVQLIGIFFFHEFAHLEDLEFHRLGTQVYLYNVAHLYVVGGTSIFSIDKHFPGVAGLTSDSSSFYDSCDLQKFI